MNEKMQDSSSIIKSDDPNQMVGELKEVTGYVTDDEVLRLAISISSSIGLGKFLWQDRDGKNEKLFAVRFYLNDGQIMSILAPADTKFEEFLNYTQPLQILANCCTCEHDDEERKPMVYH